MERTVAVIKPGAVSRKDTLNILSTIYGEFDVVDCRMLTMSRLEAEVFYSEHRGKDFFQPLIDHAVSGPCVALLLEGENAVKRWRNLMGPSDPSKLGFAHVRHWFGNQAENSVDNAVHGSDSVESAEIEASILGLGQVGAVPIDPLEIEDTLEPETVPQARFLRLDPAAVLPRRAHAEAPGYEDVGFDLTSTCDAFLPARGSVVKVPTGWRVQPPAGYELQVRTRSGLGSKGVVVANSPGTIDPNFSGELFVLLANIGKGDYQVKKGDRIAQLVPRKLDPCDCVEVDQLDSATSRGQAGYGSSGR